MGSRDPRPLDPDTSRGCYTEDGLTIALFLTRLTQAIPWNLAERRGCFFSVLPCLAARLSRRVGGVPPAPVSPSWSLGLFRLVSRTGGPEAVVITGYLVEQVADFASST
jgi:hypothetical protein